MNKKCENCGLENYLTADSCARCSTRLVKTAAQRPGTRSLLRMVFFRGGICLGVCIAAVLGFYISLIYSAKPLGIEEKATIRAATRLLSQKGFTREAFMLSNLTVYRADDNWLNASVAKESAYAATNFPFEIMTIYPDFFAYPADETERAAILLHESRHLLGADEHDAYVFVWKHREHLGWTREKYGISPVWQGVLAQTREHAPELFACGETGRSDCTE